MNREEKKDFFKDFERYMESIMDGRIAYHIQQNKHNHAHENTSFISSQPIDIALPFGWHPQKMDKLKTLHRFLHGFGIIICEYAEFESHFIGKCNGKILWIGTQTELMFLISELIHLKLIPPPAKNNLNIIIASHFRELNGDFIPKNLKVSKSKAIGKQDRIDILNEISEALK